MNINDFFDTTFAAPRPHPVGRPPKLTTEKIEEICDLIIAGYAIASAGKKCGVSESTIYRWLALGKSKNCEEIYKNFAERVAEATECSEFELLQGMRIAAKKPENWRALAWMLERRHPDKYGKKLEPGAHRIVEDGEAKGSSVLTAV